MVARRDTKYAKRFSSSLASLAPLRKPKIRSAALLQLIRRVAQIEIYATPTLSDRCWITSLRHKIVAELLAKAPQHPGPVLTNRGW